MTTLCTETTFIQPMTLDTSAVYFYSAEEGYIIKVDLEIPEQPLADNFPALQAIKLVVSPVGAEAAVTVERIWNEPIGESPRNFIGYTDMTFTLDQATPFTWHIEKAIWFGTADKVNDLGHAYAFWKDKLLRSHLDAEHRIIVSYEISGTSQQVDDVLEVTITDDLDKMSMDPLLVDFPVITDPNGIFPPGPRIVIPEVLFSKDASLNVSGAVSQYKDLLTKEEQTHKNQWLALDVCNLDWDPAEWVNDGDIKGIDNYALAHYVFQFTSMGCTWNPEERTIKIDGEVTHAQFNELKTTAEQIVTGTIKGSFLNLMERRARIEKEAKEFVGYGEAYRYEHTYMLTHEYPLNPPYASYPPPLCFPYTNLPLPDEPEL